METTAYEGWAWTPEEMREGLKDDPDQMRVVADRVTAKHCTCCGTHSVDESDRLECGHFLCDYFCRQRGHICIACALAV